MLFMFLCMLFSAGSNDSFLIEKLLKILTMYRIEQLFLALHCLQLLFINKMKKNRIHSFCQGVYNRARWF